MIYLQVDVDQFTAFFEKAAKGMNERVFSNMIQRLAEL